MNTIVQVKLFSQPHSPLVLYLYFYQILKINFPIILNSKFLLYLLLVLCQDLVQVKMRNFSHFNPPEAQPQCVFFHTIVRIHLVTYSYNGYEFVSYCRKLPDIRKSSGMLAYNHGF